MAFSATASIVSTDMDNTVRGLYRDYADHAVTGTTAETDLASTSITGGTIGSTGSIIVYAAGTCAGTNDTKDIRLKLGGTTIATVARNAGSTADWFIMAKLMNVSAAVQRWLVLFSTASAATTSMDYITSAENTAATLTLKVTGDLNNTADTITQCVMEVNVLQVQ